MVAPFRRGGTGFKDELIILSMLELLPRWNFKAAMLVSEDRDFAGHLRERFAHLKTRLFVERDLIQTLERMDLSLTAAVQAAAKKHKEAALAMARQHWEKIRQLVVDSAEKEGIPRMAVLPQLQTEKDLPDNATLKRLVHLQPKEISNILTGLVHPVSGRTLITILVACDITIEVEVTDWRSHFFRSRITVDENPPFSDYPTSARHVVTVERALSVEATALEDDQGNWSDLRLEDSGEYFKMLGEILKLDTHE